MRKTLLLLLALAACGDDANKTTVDAPSPPADAPAPDAPAAAPDPAKYCADIATHCTGSNAQYLDMDHCLGTAAAFPVGTSADTGGNTLGCRAYHAGAPSVSMPVMHCPHAGPGGDLMNGAGVCGAPCESFCAVEIKVCGSMDAPLTGITPQYKNLDACKTTCATFNKDAPYVYGGTPTTPSGDSLACRLYHLTNAALGAKNSDVLTTNAHCAHTGPTGGSSAGTCMAGTTPAP